jgi:hypothetical protein
LVKTLESVDFPTRLSTIDTNIKAVNSALNEAKQSIEKNATDNQTIIIQRLDLQDKEIKTLKTILFVICGLIHNWDSCDNISIKIANAFGSTFAVFPNAQSQTKNCKRATKPTHNDTTMDRQNDRERRTNA